MPLEVLAAPYRDIGDPLLAYLRELTDEGNDVLVVLPELILRGWRRLLHNQRALYVKRLLLVEPHVILASVPYQLDPMRLPDVTPPAPPRAALRALDGLDRAIARIVVPLLDREETEHALDLACRLAADRGARVVLVAPLVVERELPLDAHLDGQLASLKERLESATAVAGSYGVGVRREIVRTRPGCFGEEVARVAARAPGGARRRRRARRVAARLPAGVPARGPPPAARRAVPRDDRHRPAVARSKRPRRALQSRRGTTASPGAASSSAFSERTRSSRPRTATSARRSITRSAS